MSVRYGTHAEAEAYFKTKIVKAAWDEADRDRQDASRAEAKRIIDRLNYQGDKADSDQVDQFPRDTDSAVPTDIKYAEYEIALALLDGYEPDMEFDNLQATKMRYSSVSHDQQGARPAHLIAGVPSIEAWRYLLPYLRDPNSVQLSRRS